MMDVGGEFLTAQTRRQLKGKLRPEFALTPRPPRTHTRTHEQVLMFNVDGSKIWTSKDAGNTWQSFPFSLETSIDRIFFHPSQPDWFIALNGQAREVCAFLCLSSPSILCEGWWMLRACWLLMREWVGYCICLSAWVFVRASR